MESVDNSGDREVEGTSLVTAPVPSVVIGSCVLDNGDSVLIGIETVVVWDRVEENKLSGISVVTSVDKPSVTPLAVVLISVVSTEVTGDDSVTRSVIEVSFDGVTVLTSNVDDAIDSVVDSTAVVVSESLVSSVEKVVSSFVKCSVDDWAEDGNSVCVVCATVVEEPTVGASVVKAKVVPVVS